jgi:hypothetical protein
MESLLNIAFLIFLITGVFLMLIALGALVALCIEFVKEL